MAQPSLNALQTWLQLSDDLLATAWGTMDRYHLSWLMVGKPKGIVRGREMTADEEAAYVREVAEQKTAALRMSLDAVERQGMPFRGETGGVGAGQGMGEVPSAARRRRRGAGARAHRRDLASLDPPRSRDAGEARRGPPRGGRARRPRTGRHAPRAAQREAPAVTRATVPAVGGTREVPAPDDVARDYILLGLRLDQHLPGTVDGYFGPAELKARVDMEQLRSPARLADDAADLRARLPGEVSQPDRRSWLDAQLVAIETLARVKAGEPISYLEQVERCLTLRPERRPDDVFERAAARAGDAPAGRAAASPIGSRPRTRPGPSIPSASPPSSTSSSRGTASARGRHVRAPGRRGPARVASSMTSRGPATTGTTAATGPGSTSTSTSRSASRRSSASSPTRPSRGTTSSTPRRRRCWSRSSATSSRRSCSSTRPSACCPRGSRTSVARSPSRRRRCPTCSWSWRRSPGCRWPATRRAAGGRRAPGGHRGPSGDARRVAHQRGADAPRRRRVARGGGRVHGRGRADEPGHRGKARRVRRRTRCGACTTTSTPRARRCCGHGSRPCPNRNRRRASAACSGSR